MLMSNQTILELQKSKMSEVTVATKTKLQGLVVVLAEVGMKKINL